MTSTLGAGGELPKIKPLELDPEEKSYQAAIEMLDKEIQKPLMERDYGQAETALKDVAAKAKAVYLLSDVEAALAKIEFQRSLQEAMKKNAADAKALEAELEAIRQKEAAMGTKAAVSPVDTMREPQFTGVLKTMLTRMAYKYRIEDAAGNYLCLAEGPEATLAPMVGKKVRVWGDTKYRVDLRMTIVTVKTIEEAR
jgi:hypothetical protein